MGQSAVTEFRFTAVGKTVCQAQLIYMDKHVLASIRKQYSTWALPFRKTIIIIPCQIARIYGEKEDYSKPEFTHKP